MAMVFVLHVSAAPLKVSASECQSVYSTTLSQHWRGDMSPSIVQKNRESLIIPMVQALLSVIHHVYLQSLMTDSPPR